MDNIYRKASRMIGPKIQKNEYLEYEKKSLTERVCVADNLQQAALVSCADAVVKHHLHVQFLFLPEVTHHAQQLHDQRVLTQIVAHLQHQLDVPAGVGVLQHEPQRLLFTLHHAAPADVNTANLFLFCLCKVG